jgi:hypothetical protein
LFFLCCRQKEGSKSKLNVGISNTIFEIVLRILNNIFSRSVDARRQHLRRIFSLQQQQSSIKTDQNQNASSNPNKEYLDKQPWRECCHLSSSLHYYYF